MFTIESSNITVNYDELEMDLIDAGLEEMDLDKEYITIYCDYLDFNNMQVKLESLNIEIQNQNSKEFQIILKHLMQKKLKKLLNY